MTIGSSLSLIIFYLFAAKLPRSTRPGGKKAKRIRLLLAKRIFKYCGNHVNIEDHCWFGNGKDLEIGDYSGIGSYCEIYGPVKIGKYVMMAPDVKILTAHHEFSDTDTPMCFQGNRSAKQVIIEDDVWIGTRVIILPGVRIGKGSIIGAGSVVTQDVQSFDVVGGVPAVVIKNRKELVGSNHLDL